MEIESTANAYTTSLRILGHNIRRIREMRQYSYLELALLCKYNRQYLSALELGEKDIQLSTVVKIARALDVPLSQLFSRSFDGSIDLLSEHFTSDDFLLVFCTNVRRYLSASGKKEFHIYMETGMDTATINRILNQHITNPRISTLSKISTGIGIDLGSLLTRTERGL